MANAPASTVTNVQQSLAIKLDHPVTSISISPSYCDAVLAAKRGLYLLNLENPYEQPRFLQHLTKWDVADVQWNPHSHRSNWIATTSNQKTLIWNIARGVPAAGSVQSVSSTQNNVEFILNKHVRAVSDIHWSPFHPESIATCSYDAFIHLWDLRLGPSKPSASFSSWTVGATQVKYNRINEWMLASSHDTDVRIWDARKGSSPLTLITAHMTKIYGIDWSHKNENEIITCSQDKLVKFWNISQPRMCQSTIVTTAPVWRARYTPFGNAVITMPQRKDNNLYLWSCENRTSPLYTFSGHSDVPAEFVWRCIDGHYQLVTWSKDHTMRLWPVSSDVVKAAGYRSERGSPTEPLGDEQVDLTAQLSETPQIIPPDTPSQTISRQARNPFPKFPRDLDMMPFEDDDDDLSDGGLELRSVSPLTTPTALFDPNSKEGKRSTSWLSRASSTLSDNVREYTALPGSTSPYRATLLNAASFHAPTSLEEEVHQIELQFPDVHIDKTNIRQRICSLSIESASDHLRPTSAVGSGLLSVFLRIDVHFPHLYPSAAPHFEIQKTGMTSMANRTFLTAKIGQIGSAFAAKSLPCLEACVRYLLGDPNATAPIPSSQVYGETLNVSSLSEASTGISGDSHFDHDRDYTHSRELRNFGRSATDYPMSETSSSDPDGSLPLMGRRVKPMDDHRLMRETTTGKDNSNIPFPVLCAASFSMCGKLVYFKSPLPHPSTTKFTTYTLSSRNQQPVLQSQHFQTQPKTYPLYESYRAFVLARFPKITVTGVGAGIGVNASESDLLALDGGTIDSQTRSRAKMDFWLDDDPAGEEETAPSLFWRPKPAPSIQPTVFTSPDFLAQLQRFSSPAPTASSGTPAKKKRSTAASTNLFGAKALESSPSVRSESGSQRKPSIHSTIVSTKYHSQKIERGDNAFLHDGVRRHRRCSSTASLSSNASDISINEMLANGLGAPFTINSSIKNSSSVMAVGVASPSMITLSPPSANTRSSATRGSLLQISMTPTLCPQPSLAESIPSSSMDVPSSSILYKNLSGWPLYPTTTAAGAFSGTIDGPKSTRRRHRSNSDTSDCIRRHLKSELDGLDSESASDLSDVELRFGPRYGRNIYGRSQAPIACTPVRSGDYGLTVMTPTPLAASPKGNFASNDAQSGYGTIVYCWDISNLLPVRKNLADIYTFTGSNPGEVCCANRDSMMSIGRPDLARIWTIAGLIVGQHVIDQRSADHCKDMPFKRMQWQNHPFGRCMVHSLFEHLEKLGDIQTLAMLVCVFSQQHMFSTETVAVAASYSESGDESIPTYSQMRWQRHLPMNYISEPRMSSSPLSPSAQRTITRSAYSGPDLPFLAIPGTSFTATNSGRIINRSNSSQQQSSVHSLRGHPRMQSLIPSFSLGGYPTLSGVSMGSVSSLVQSSVGSILSSTGLPYFSEPTSQVTIIGSTASKSMGIPSRHRETGGRLVRTLSTGGAGPAAAGRQGISMSLSNPHLAGMSSQTPPSSIVPLVVPSMDRTSMFHMQRIALGGLSPPSMTPTHSPSSASGVFNISSPSEIAASLANPSPIGAVSAVLSSTSSLSAAPTLNLVMTNVCSEGNDYDEFERVSPMPLQMLPQQTTPNMFFPEGHRLSQSPVLSPESSDHMLLNPSHCGAYNGYLWRYAELLYAWGFLKKRAELLKFRVFFVSGDQFSDESVGNLSLACVVCNSELRYHRDGYHCPECHLLASGFRCSMCRLPCKGLAQLCLMCKHGGHVEHIQAWFSDNKECPAACGCECLEQGAELWSSASRI
ncbi:hypothetical protein BASA61_009212 [Batrachochytrium salamandrivorans]|nr:hypothetical protein BASA61_009212 [Batrachochytrium salamandrivorans]